ncbi:MULTISPECIES: alpha/beta fold hydrolase [Pontibacillus]|uniref:Alpha/beta hydrolase n=1 Tax=Pontibacillus chungwhensis TaxID=265426 RepID=A0ABY8V1G0_9BACI|nr:MULTISPECIES: alpha/beta hydrolase [Pontibacillus]MCD5322296.1 alpha/beta hydrolase [Pontibacillus sp. HN14]WIF99589.1 alpha/beta hydrolase [Pontibacillus chungwhensis]
MSHFIEVESGVKLFVEDIGEGQPIVFIHGWPLNHKMFEYQMNELPQKGYRFIGIDLRGFGQSDKPAFGYDYDTLAHDIKVVVETLELKNFFLAGFSMGGPISIQYATKHANDQLAQLILIGAAAPSFTARDGFQHGMPQEEVDGLINAFQNDRPKALKDFGGNFFHKATSAPFDEWFFHLGLEASSHATIETAKSLRDEDLRHVLEYVNVPTLIMHGEDDNICDYAFSEILHNEIKDSTFVSFEISGHGLVYDEREKCNEELLKLLK